MAVDKLVDSTLLDAACTYEAGKIREKLGSSAQIAYDLANGKGFGDAIAAIPTGGGGNPGGLANMVDVSSWTYRHAYMMSCIKNGDTVGGTFTKTSAFPNTETLFLSTGLTTLHGIVVIGTDQNWGDTGGTQSNKWFVMFVAQDANARISMWGMASSGTTITSKIAQDQSTAVNGAPFNGAIRIDGGDIYYSARYNKNAGYQLVVNNKPYEWLAW